MRSTSHKQRPWPIDDLSDLMPHCFFVFTLPFHCVKFLGVRIFCKHNKHLVHHISPLIIGHQPQRHARERAVVIIPPLPSAAAAAAAAFAASAPPAFAPQQTHDIGCLVRKRMQ